MPPAMLLTVLGQIGEALHAAHQLGIVHRDVKPENLFLHRRADGVAVAKVLDFGISKFSADAAASETLRFEDVPSSPTKSDAARASFRAAMRSNADGAPSRARNLLDEAMREDPGFASAQLQRAYLSLTDAGDLDAAGREAFRQASAYRASLGDRDRALLEGLAPAFLDPPDFSEAAVRLQKFAAASPRDAQGQDALGYVLTKAGDQAGSDRAFRAELMIEPGLPEAAQLVAQALIAEQQPAEAMRVLDECARSAPTAIMCRVQKTALLSTLGRCQLGGPAPRAFRSRMRRPTPSAGPSAGRTARDVALLLRAPRRPLL